MLKRLSNPAGKKDKTKQNKTKTKTKKQVSQKKIKASPY